MKTPYYFDPVDGSRYPIDEARWRSAAGRPLMISELAGMDAADIDRSCRSQWRYRAALPIAIGDAVSMGEGLTPLVEDSYEGLSVFFKLEWFAPTGSFKDRGASVMIAYLRQAGVESILEDSSGNGGAAISAYGRRAGMKVKILAPAGTQEAKIAQMRAFEAEVQLVPGPRQACQDEAIRQSDERFYASHNWQAFFLQGTKLLAYELWEDFGFTAPDNIVIPLGAGSNVLGCHIGFSELLRSGAVSRMPRLFGVQPANCAPVDAALNAGADDWIDVEVQPTIAEGTAIRRPVRTREVLAAIRASGGSTVTNSEAEIADAVRKLARRGIFAEPTSANAAAAVSKLVDAGKIARGERTVVILTGTGIKSAGAMASIFGA